MCLVDPPSSHLPLEWQGGVEIVVKNIELLKHDKYLYLFPHLQVAAVRSVPDYQAHRAS